MSEELKFIIQQNTIIVRLLQCLMLYVGIKNENLEKILNKIIKDVEKETEERIKKSKKD